MHKHMHSFSCLDEMPNGDIYCRKEKEVFRTAAAVETGIEDILSASRAKIRKKSEKPRPRLRRVKWDARAFFRTLDTLRAKGNPHADAGSSARPLSGRARELASRYIVEEMRTGKYPRRQAIAIGLARARRETGE